MLDEENYSSDTSDEDYVPGADSHGEEISSEEEQAAVDSNEDCDPDSRTVSLKSTKALKRKKPSKKATKGSIKDVDPGLEKEKETTSLADDPSKVEKIWESFKKDTQSPKSKAADEDKSASSSVVEEPKVFEFAGEIVNVTEEGKIASSSSGKQVAETKRPPPPIRSGGLSSLANKLSNKKPKLSTLEKSKLDWDTFKRDEGISEELKSYNQGKMGYLERQAFLERADLKQFEIEKDFRAGRKPPK